VATVHTRRVVHRLLDREGRPLAELADDTVTGQRLAAGAGTAPAELAWREWEVELFSAEEALLDAVEERVLAAGARPAKSSSKLARLLPRPSSEDGDRPWWAVPKKHGRTTAGEAVLAHLAEQVAELIARDPQTRRDLPDALHKMRVATRRLRSALSTFGPLLDRARTDPLRDELRWLAGVLGAARDAEVMHARLLSLVAAEPDDLVLGRVQDRIDTLMVQRHRTAHDTVITELDGERYLRLLDALDDLVARPPFQPDAGANASDLLPRLVRRTWRRLDRRMSAAERTPRGAAQDELLHDVRKDAKQSRYAAEAVQGVCGRRAGRYAAAVTELQESLGDFQDGVVTREVLRELGAQGHLAGQNGFTFGRLHALEQVKAEAAVAAFPQARAVMSRRRLRRWFDG
jgi:CHAD domain-containing protein